MKTDDSIMEETKMQTQNETLTKCRACDGDGFVLFRCGEDDVDMECCDFCDGTGHDIPHFPIQEKVA